MRLDAYIRVSRVGGREGDSFISPKLQRERCQGVAMAGGHNIVTWHEDLDQPGSKASRPGFQAALERVESGETDGIVVARLDRFARSLADAATALRRINDADGALISAQESLDTSTSFGRFAMHMMLALAELELERVRESWAAARGAAVDRGIHIASRTPTGYDRDEDKRLVPNDDGEAITQAFQKRAQGMSWADLGRFLQGQGVRTPYGAEIWTSRSISHLIANRAYLGEARSGEFVMPNAHPPLTDVGTWQRAQSPKMIVTASDSRSLLTGLIRCAGCRYVLKPDRVKDRRGEKYTTYRCRGLRAAGRCEKRAAVTARIADNWVIEQFFERVGDIQAREVKIDDRTPEAKERLTTAEAELEAFLEADVAEIVGVDRFRRGVAQRQRAVEDAQAVLSELQDQAEPIGEDVIEMKAIWPELTTAEKRRLLSAGIDTVFLRNVGQANVPIGDRALIVWKGEAPNDLPGPGRKLGGIRSFDW